MISWGILHVFFLAFLASWRLIRPPQLAPFSASRYISRVFPRSLNTCQIFAPCLAVHLNIERRFSMTKEAEIITNRETFEGDGLEVEAFVARPDDLEKA